MLQTRARHEGALRLLPCACRRLSLMEASSPPPAWSPHVEPLDDNVLSRVRALVADPPTQYFDDRSDDGRPGSDHVERAVQVQLLRSLAAAPACEVTDRNRALALGMRQRLLGEGAASPGVADELDERLGAWCAAHWPARHRPELRLWRFEGTGRGLACRAALAAGEAALAVPEALLLTAAPTLAHARVAPRLAACGIELHEDVALALALLLQPALHPDGSWAAYMPLLPRRPPSALLWPQAALARVAATQIAPQVRAALAST